MLESKLMGIYKVDIVRLGFYIPSQIVRTIKENFDNPNIIAIPQKEDEFRYIQFEPVANTSYISKTRKIRKGISFNDERIFGIVAKLKESGIKPQVNSNKNSPA